MSPAGSTALGTLLVQRLDAVLGTTMAHHANLITGARPDAVSGTALLARIGATQDATVTDIRHAVERVTQHAGQDPRAAIKDARLQASLAAGTRPGRLTATDSTPSAPTTLGATARTILALLAQYPDNAPATGRQPLWQPQADAQARQQQPAPGRAGPGAPPGTGPAAAPGSGPGAAPAPGAGASPPAGQASPAASAAQAALQPSLAQTPAAPVLARALAQALDTSGMFYESHLAGLAFGKRTPAQLSAEPQAQFAARSAAPQPAAAQGGAPASGAQGAADAGPSAPPPPAGAAAAAALPGTALSPEAAVLVRQQLEVLAHQLFSWQGEAWPEAPMEWEVGRDAERDTPDGLQTWATRLKLTLPRLGEVEARLSLAGSQLVMHVSAPESAGMLQEHAGTLRERYEAAGFVLSNLSFDDGAAGGDADDAGHAPGEPR